jgi:DivIVA domain-containing protein
MGQFLLVLVVAIVAAAIVFGVVTMISDADAGLGHAEPDGRAVPLPGARPLAEGDIAALRFDTTVRGYRMEQVDQALRRTAYDIGYKDELITVLEAEVEALRAGRQEEADELRAARKAASPTGAFERLADDPSGAAAGEPAIDLSGEAAPTTEVSPTSEAAPAEQAAGGEATAPADAVTAPGGEATAPDEVTAQADDEADDAADGDDPADDGSGEAAVAGASRAGAEHGR